MTYLAPAASNGEGDVWVKIAERGSVLRSITLTLRRIRADDFPPALQILGRLVGRHRPHRQRRQARHHPAVDARPGRLPRPRRDPRCARSASLSLPLVSLPSGSADRSCARSASCGLSPFSPARVRHALHGQLGPRHSALPVVRPADHHVRRLAGPARRRLLPRVRLLLLPCLPPKILS